MALRPVSVRATPSFASILDKPVDQIERPKPMPEGTYLLQVKGQPEIGKSAQKQTDQVKFTFEFVQAADDVDQVQLQQSGGCQGKTISNNTTTFYLTEKSAWRLPVFLEEILGIPTVDADSNEALTVRQMMAYANTRRFWGVIKHVHPKDRPNETFMEIANWAHIDAAQGEDEPGEAGEYDEAS